MMHQSRRGFSLMEVLLATSILLASSIALVELATIGRKQANAAYDLNLAQLLCQAKLDEIAVGIAPMKSVESQQLEENPDWYYSVELMPLRVRELVSVNVSVFQQPRSTGRPARFALVRWMPDAAVTSSNATNPSATNAVNEMTRGTTSNSRSRISRTEEAP